MRGAAALWAAAALAADSPGVATAVPGAPELKILNVAVIADVMQQLLRARWFRRYAGASEEPVMVLHWQFPIAPPAGVSRERRSREMHNTWGHAMHTSWGRALRTTWS